MMKICDRVAQVANEITPEPKLVLKYKKNHVALCTPGSFFNVMAFLPRSNFVLIRFRAADPAAWVTRSTDAGIVAELAKHGTRVAVRLRSGDVEQHQELLRELIHESIKEKRGSDSRNAGRETIHIHKCSEALLVGHPAP